MFSYFGVIVVAMLMFLVLLLYMVFGILRKTLNIWRVIISVAASITIVLLSSFILLYNFPVPSQVDISPLERTGNAQITDFEERQLVLEDSPFFLRSNPQAFNYRFGFQIYPTVHFLPIVDLTIYPLTNQEDAYENLVIAAGPQARRIQKLSDTVYVLASDSVYFRTRDGHMTDDLDRQVITRFIIGNHLFILREVGDRDRIGESSTIVIEMLYDIFIE